MTMETVCVVLPAYNERGALGQLIPKIFETLTASGVRPSVCVVDDGSTDGTFEWVLNLRKSDERIQIIQLSRNFGHQAALLAGLRNISADAVVMMDADGQHPVSALAGMIETWRNGCDVINTVPEAGGQSGLFRRSAGRCFYSLFRRLTGLPLAEGMSDFRLLNRKAHNATLEAVGKRPFLRGTTAWIGLKQASVSYAMNERSHGRRKYTIRLLLSLARDGIVGFSNRPLLIVASLGAAWSLLVGIYASVFIAIEIATGRDVPGWVSIVAILSTMQGLIFLMMAVLGAYIGSVHNEVVGRPTYVIQESSLTKLG
jgi:glycosyltransferase involved in cell wall biosynthesis